LPLAEVSELLRTDDTSQAQPPAGNSQLKRQTESTATLMSLSLDTTTDRDLAFRLTVRDEMSTRSSFMARVSLHRSSSSGKSFTIICKSPEDKVQWMTQIEQAKASCGDFVVKMNDSRSSTSSLKPALSFARKSANLHRKQAKTDVSANICTEDATHPLQSEEAFYNVTEHNPIEDDYQTSEHILAYDDSASQILPLPTESNADTIDTVLWTKKADILAESNVSVATGDSEMRSLSAGDLGPQDALATGDDKSSSANSPCKKPPVELGSNSIKFVSSMMYEVVV
jgi:hypothetical protein